MDSFEWKYETFTLTHTPVYLFTQCKFIVRNGMVFTSEQRRGRKCKNSPMSRGNAAVLHGAEAVIEERG